jgi:hypothetical protein
VVIDVLDAGTVAQPCSSGTASAVAVSFRVIWHV